MANLADVFFLRRGFSFREIRTETESETVQAAVEDGAAAGGLIWHLVDEGVGYDSPWYAVYKSHSTWRLVERFAARMRARAAGGSCRGL